MGARRAGAFDAGAPAGGAAAGGGARRDRAHRARSAARALHRRAPGRRGRGRELVRRAGCGRARRLGAGAAQGRRVRAAGAGRAGIPRARRARPRARRARGDDALRRRRRPVVAVGGPVRPAREPVRARARRPARTRCVVSAKPAGVELTVVGSINLDLVAYCERLPRPGETVTNARFERHPGGKGANQAVAEARLGARVRMVGCVGRDPYAGEALAGLREATVELDLQEVDEATGVALITVDAEGENEIVVAPGANARLQPRSVDGPVLCQLEIPDEVVREACRGASFTCLNAAPARPIDIEPDLLVVNRYELEVVGEAPGLVALTLGAEGAVLLAGGAEVARARPPRVDAVDGTAAGDAFTACLVVSLLEGRDRDEALRRACAAGAIAASRRGAQPSLPTAAEVDAILGG